MVAQTGSALHAVAAAGPCVSCGTYYESRFCPHCGEKRIDQHDYSVAHFAEHAFETFTHLDSKLLRTLKALMMRPGLLTCEYLRGRRRPYMAPTQLFVIVNVLFALLINYTGVSPFNTPLQAQFNNPPLIVAKKSAVAKAIAETGLSDAEYERRFNQTANLQSKTLIFVMIPALAGLLGLLYGFRRQYGEHLIWVTHFFAFLLLFSLPYFFAFIQAYKAAVHAGFAVSGDMLENSLSLTWAMIITVYVGFALRGAFGGSWWAAATRAVLLAAGMYPMILAYRLLLFGVTLRLTH
jgi:hypothetical protein